MKKGKAVVILVFILACVGFFGWYGTTIITDTQKKQEATADGEDVSEKKFQNIKLGLDLSGGVSITYQIKDENPSKTDIKDTIAKLEERAGSYTTEYSVYQNGDDRITVEIPGVDDPNEILEDLGSPVSQYDSDGNANYTADSSVDGGYKLNYDIQKLIDNGSVVMDGNDVKSAEATYQQESQTSSQEPVVELKLKDDAIDKWGEVTTAAKEKGQSIGIYYDDHFISVPTVSAAITDGNCVINGMKNYDEATQLATFIRVGAINLELEEMESNVVGAQLGEEAISSSLKAAAIGLVIVMIFMIVQYLVPGVVAAFALAIYTTLVIATLYLFEITLTLPGIAGIILSIGMAVDANCIIFTRIREELATGKTVASAIDNGFSKAMSAIVDGNVTTLIAALVLYLKGSGTVKGFAMTLGIGIVLSMFTALFITKLLMKAFCALGMTNTSMYGIQKERKTINFIGNWKKYVVISGAVVVICVAGLVVRAASGGPLFNYSLDFAGGNSTSVDLSKTVTDEDKQKAEDTAKSVIGSGKSVEISVADNTKIVVRTEELSEQKSEELKATMAKTFGVDESTKIESEFISGSVSDEMKVDAAVATLIATLCMLLYIWIRFRKLSTGISAVLALVHDVIAVLTVYVVASAFIPVGSTFIACMLTIVGYSINDTIVVFDRIRENKAKATSRTSLAEIINKSITETLSRSINTSVTTFIMVFVLAVFGVDSVRQFAIPLIVGIISGCYSSVCVASPLWYVLSGKGEKEQKAVTYSKKKK